MLQQNLQEFSKAFHDFFGKIKTIQVPINKEKFQDPWEPIQSSKSTCYISSNDSVSSVSICWSSSNNLLQAQKSYRSLHKTITIRIANLDIGSWLASASLSDISKALLKASSSDYTLNNKANITVRYT